MSVGRHRTGIHGDPLTHDGQRSTFPPAESSQLNEPSLHLLSELFQRLRDLPALVQWAGYLGLTIIIFAETGLLAGFFLPGDSLLVTAGLLSSQADFGLNVWKLGKSNGRFCG